MLTYVHLHLFCVFCHKHCLFPGEKFLFCDGKCFVCVIVCMYIIGLTQIFIIKYSDLYSFYHYSNVKTGNQLIILSLFCLYNCCCVTVWIVCKGITLYRHLPFVYPFKQFDNNNLFLVSVC